MGGCDTRQNDNQMARPTEKVSGGTMFHPEENAEQLPDHGKEQTVWDGSPQDTETSVETKRSEV